MARVKTLPSLVIDLSTLTPAQREMYDSVTREYSKKTINELRRIAKDIGVESPTTLSKKKLVRRIVDREVAAYLPPECLETPQTRLTKEIVNFDGERIKGYLVDEGNGVYRIDDVAVALAIVRKYNLRYGDLAEGLVVNVEGLRKLTLVNNVDGESTDAQREWFDKIKVSRRREFGAMIMSNKAHALLPDLKMGERIIAKGLTIEQVVELSKAYPLCINLFMGVLPEETEKIDLTDKNNFVVGFDSPKKTYVQTAELALNRAKRLSERGKDVLMIVYGFNEIGNDDVERGIFGVGRCFDKGSITVLADVDATNDRKVFARVATRVIENMNEFSDEKAEIAPQDDKDKE